MKLLALMTLLLAGCAHSPEVQLLVGPRRVNLGETEAGFTILVLQQIGETRWRCGWTHDSVIDKGEPFHAERPEITFDQLACGPRWGGNRGAFRF